LRRGGDGRHLSAYLDAEGGLHIDGQDSGPGTELVAGDDEVESFMTVNVVDVPQLASLVGALEEKDLLDVLERDWSGDQAGELEALLRRSIPVKRFVL
jgi:hypothetical protein